MVFVPSEFLPEYRPARKFPLISSKGWWLNRWPFLGWLETFVKAAAWLFVPYVVVKDAALVDVRTFPLNFAVETWLMLTASFLLLLAIVDRMVYREIISMIFVFPNNWAHWTIALAMHRFGRNGINLRYLRIFCWLTFVGDIVKLIFFAYHDFSRLNVSRYFLYMLVAIFAILYLIVLLMDYGYISITASGRMASFCNSCIVPSLIKLQTFRRYFSSL